MGAEGADVYVAGTLARWVATRRPGQAAVDLPGIHGLLPCPERPRARLLVTDDRAYDTLAALLPDLHAGAIDVFDAAIRCAGLIDGQCGWWVSERSTAMVCGDLRSVPASELPSELTLRRVRRLSGDPPEGVPLEDARAAVLLADPRIEDPDAFADFVDSLPPEAHLFAAVDRDGVVRATSGLVALGSEGRVFFVNTVPGWRGRGIGQAMTAAAVHAALEHGAERVCLDATGAGLGIYRRLGFETVSQSTRFTAPLSAPASRGEPHHRGDGGRCRPSE